MVRTVNEIEGLQFDSGEVGEKENEKSDSPTPEGVVTTKVIVPGDEGSKVRLNHLALDFINAESELDVNGVTIEFIKCSKKYSPMNIEVVFETIEQKLGTFSDYKRREYLFTKASVRSQYSCKYFTSLNNTRSTDLMTMESYIAYLNDPSYQFEKDRFIFAFQHLLLHQDAFQEYAAEALRILKRLLDTEHLFLEDCFMLQIIRCLIKVNILPKDQHSDFIDEFFNLLKTDNDVEACTSAFEFVSKYDMGAEQEFPHFVEHIFQKMHGFGTDTRFILKRDKISKYMEVARRIERKVRPFSSLFGDNVFMPIQHEVGNIFLTPAKEEFHKLDPQIKEECIQKAEYYYIGTTNARILSWFGDYYLEKGDFKKALSYCERINERGFSTETSTITCLYQIWKQNGDEETRKKCYRLITQFPHLIKEKVPGKMINVVRALNKIAESKSELNFFVRFVNILANKRWDIGTLPLEIDSIQDELNLYKAECMRRLGDYDNALIAYNELEKKLVRFSVESALEDRRTGFLCLSLGRAVILSKMGKHAEVIQILECFFPTQAEKHEPDEVRLSAMSAWVKSSIALNRPEKALQACREFEQFKILKNETLYRFISDALGPIEEVNAWAIRRVQDITDVVDLASYFLPKLDSYEELGKQALLDELIRRFDVKFSEPKQSVLFYKYYYDLLLKNGDFQKAVDMLKVAIPNTEIQERNPLLTKLGMTLIDNLDRKDEGIQALVEARNNPAAEQIGMRLNCLYLIKTLVEKKRFEEAVEHIREFLRYDLDEKDFYLLKFLGDFCVRTNRKDLAILLYEKHLDKKPKDHKVKFALLQVRGDKEGLNTLIDALSMMPQKKVTSESKEVLLDALNVAITWDEKNRKKLLNRLEMVCELTSDRETKFSCHFRIGKESGDLMQRRIHLEEASKIHPSDDCLLEYAEVLMLSNETEKAKEKLKMISTKSARYHTICARTDKNNALSHFERAYAKKEECSERLQVELLSYFANALCQKKEWTRASELLDEVLTMNCDRMSLLKERKDVYLQLGRYADALLDLFELKDFEEVKKVASKLDSITCTNVEDLEKIGHALFGAELYEKAQGVFYQLVEKAKSREFHRYLGLSLMLDGFVCLSQTVPPAKIKEAIVHLREGGCCYDLAKALYLNGEFKEAKEVLDRLQIETKETKVLRALIDPTLVDLYTITPFSKEDFDTSLLLAKLYDNHNQQVKAVEEIEWAFTIPQLAEDQLKQLTLKYFEVLTKQGAFTEIIREMRCAFDEPHHYYVGRAYKELGQNERAIEHLTQVKTEGRFKLLADADLAEIRGDSSSFDTIIQSGQAKAEHYYKDALQHIETNPDRAISHFHSSLSDAKDPLKCEALFHLGQLYSSRAKSKEAAYNEASDEYHEKQKEKSALSSIVVLLQKNDPKGELPAHLSKLADLEKEIHELESKYAQLQKEYSADYQSSKEAFEALLASRFAKQNMQEQYNETLTLLGDLNEYLGFAHDAMQNFGKQLSQLRSKIKGKRKSVGSQFDNKIKIIEFKMARLAFRNMSSFSESERDDWFKTFMSRTQFSTKEEIRLKIDICRFQGNVAGQDSGYKFLMNHRETKEQEKPDIFLQRVQMNLEWGQYDHVINLIGKSSELEMTFFLAEAYEGKQDFGKALEFYTKYNDASDSPKVKLALERCLTILLINLEDDDRFKEYLDKWPQEMPKTVQVKLLERRFNSKVSMANPSTSVVFEKKAPNLKEIIGQSEHERLKGILERPDLTFEEEMAVYERQYKLHKGLHSFVKARKALDKYITLPSIHGQKQAWHERVKALRIDFHEWMFEKRCFIPGTNQSLMIPMCYKIEFEHILSLYHSRQWNRALEYVHQFLLRLDDRKDALAKAQVYILRAQIMLAIIDCSKLKIHNHGDSRHVLSDYFAAERCEGVLTPQLRYLCSRYHLWMLSELEPRKWASKFF